MAAAAILGTTLLCSSQQPAAEDAYVRQLRTAADEAAGGNLSAAMADLQAAVALKPREASGWYQLGLLAGQKGDFPSAEAAFRRAISLQPGLAKAHYNLALTLVANPQNKEDWTGAIAECREALTLQPDDAEALSLLGAGLNKQAQPDAAIEALERALALQPALASAHFNLAIALENKDQLDGAAKQYQAAIAAKGKYPEASSAFGRLLLRMGKPAEAQQEETAALRFNPDLADAHYTLARVLQSLHRKQEAAVEFAEAKDLMDRPSNSIQSSQMSNKGLELASKGDMNGAEASLKAAIALKPDYGLPHYNLGLIYADRGDLGNARRELSKAISLMPGEAAPWFELGRVLELAKDNRAAFQALSWAAHLAPSNPSIRAQLDRLDASGYGPVTQPIIGAASDTAAAHVAFAKELSRDGDLEGAIGELLRAVALQPASQDARRDLADAYAELGQRDHAVLEYHKLLLAFPDDVAAHISLGKMLLAQGNPREAADQLRQALVYQPRSPEAHSLLKKADQLAQSH